MIRSAEKLAQDVREILLEAQLSVSEPLGYQESLKDTYFFMLEYRTKVLSACQRENRAAAAFAALMLQEEMCGFINEAEKGYWCNAFNILGDYIDGYKRAGFPDLTEPAAAGDLELLAERVVDLDLKLQTWFARHGIALGVLDSDEELVRFLDLRDPVGMDHPVCNT